jgi:hypothetical protein
MSPWVWALVAGVVLVVGIPLAALAGKGVGTKVRGNLQLAAILLGFGEPLDPPSKHLAEAGERDENEAPSPGEPPAPRA